MQALKPGSYLRNETYQIDKILGQGGFGITYLATDLTLDRKVAIKEFFPKDYCDREGSTSHVTLGTRSNTEFVTKLKAKFLKEARNIAKFDHPGIIRIHAAFEENNTAYYVMDYIEGHSLSEMVKRFGPLPEQKAIGYINKVGESLEYLHHQHMNHLDVKPANIMVRDSDGMPILIDFGLSKQYDSEGHQTSTTPTGISHGYAPMEQYNDGGVREFSPQTDLYSLAATLYYILSGVVPPQATKLIDEELTFPQTIPVSLMGPISKAMSVGRKYRHENIRRFLSDLDNKESDKTEIPSQKPAQQPKPQPKPTPQPKPAQKPQLKPIAELKEKEKSSIWKRILKWIGWSVAGIVALFLVLAFWIGDETPAEESSDRITTVSDMYWNSPLGTASYTGEVLPDSVNTSSYIPHGHGVARISGGEYDGAVYDGEFNYGKMEGQTTYTMKNGDTFVGTYKDNKYDKGRYTINANGEYFEGTFKNGNPDVGNWYDKNGNKLE